MKIPPRLVLLFPFAIPFLTSLDAQEQLGDFQANSWRPYNAASDDLYIDAEPGTRLLRTRNWNASMPNIRATGIHTGEGIFDTSVSVYAYGKQSYFKLTNNANNSLDLAYVRSDGANLFHVNGHSGAADFGGRLGIGEDSPQALLHVGQSNSEIRFDYNGTDQYYGSLRWSGLQFGNNGANRIVAGRTTVGGRLEFWVNNTNEGANYQETPNGLLAMLLSANGNIGIGTAVPQNKLDVNGTVRAKEVIVATDWPDYVFEDGYVLKPLEEVSAHIEQHGRLPGLPSAAEVAANGVAIGDAQRLLLEKVEELTLYAIEQKTENEALSLRVRQLEARLLALERQE